MTQEPCLVATQILAQYCRALDSGRPEELKRLLHQDAMLDLGDVKHHGIREVVHSYESYFAASERTTRHHLTNVVVLSATSSRIDVEAYFLVITEKEGAVSLASGEYRDELARIDDRWVIARKQIRLAVPFTRLPGPLTEKEPGR